MLRMRLLPNGQQQVSEVVPHYQIPILDLGGDPEAITARLEQIRSEMSHQVLPGADGFLFDIRATVRSSQVRLHLSFDLLIADIWSMLMKPGQFFLFISRCMHGSEPNTSKSSTRYGWSTRFVTTDVRVYADGGDSFHHFGEDLSLERYAAVLVAANSRIICTFLYYLTGSSPPICAIITRNSRLRVLSVLFCIINPTLQFRKFV